MRAVSKLRGTIARVATGGSPDESGRLRVLLLEMRKLPQVGLIEDQDRARSSSASAEGQGEGLAQSRGAQIGKCQNTGYGYMHMLHHSFEAYLHQISILSNITNTDYLCVVRIAHGGQVKVGFLATRLWTESS